MAQILAKLMALMPMHVYMFDIICTNLYIVHMYKCTYCTISNLYVQYVHLYMRLNVHIVHIMYNMYISTDMYMVHTGTNVLTVHIVNLYVQYVIMYICINVQTVHLCTICTFVLMYMCTYWFKCTYCSKRTYSTYLCTICTKCRKYVRVHLAVEVRQLAVEGYVLKITSQASQVVCEDFSNISALPAYICTYCTLFA